MPPYVVKSWRNLLNGYIKVKLYLGMRLFPNTKVRFGLLQYPLASDAFINFNRVLKKLEAIRKKKPHYIVLPEMWLGGPKDVGSRSLWMDIYSTSLKKLMRWCATYQIGCFFSQLEEDGGRFFNTAYFIERTGRIRGTYRKIHLFSLGGEKKIFSSGSQTKILNSLMGKIACVVCYDIRFPEFIRKLAIQGAKVLVVCAQWPDQRREHWLTLLRARAIENQIFVIAVNRLGWKEKNHYVGDSVIFDPWGHEVTRLMAHRMGAVVEIDLSLVDQIRKKYPFFQERKRKY